MNTKIESQADVKSPASTITEADVIAWLKAKRDAAGLPNIAIGVDTNYHKPFIVRSTGDCYISEFGDTISEAINILRQKLDPKVIAGAKRAEAAKLLAEADTIRPMNTEFKPLPATVTPLGVGLHDNIPSALYHSDPCSEPSLSSGVLRTILSKSIEHGALEHSRIGGSKRESTPSMGLGSIVHSLLAGESSELVLGNFDNYRSKAAQEWKREIEASGKTPVLERDFEDARPIARAVRAKAALGITNDPFAPHGRSEVTSVWKEDDAWCRARYDRLIVDPTGYADIWDWKTTNDISVRALEKTIANMGYHIQAAFYLRGLATVLPQYAGRLSFIFCFVENVAPYHVRRVTLSPAFMAIARKKVSEGIELWQHALAANDFTVSAFDTLEIEAPAYLDEEEEISISAAA